MELILKDRKKEREKITQESNVFKSLSMTNCL